jgi:hypothetical protein
MLGFFKSLPAVAFIYSVRAVHKVTQRDVLFQESQFTFLANLQRASDNSCSRPVSSGSEFES